MRMEEYVIKNQKKLRLGITTGTCSAAAAQAAAMQLLLGVESHGVTLRTPKGMTVSVPVYLLESDSRKASYKVVKDSGDDPDVTNGTDVCVTEEEIIAAAKAAHSYGFIKRMSNGFDTVIGEDGGSLSQGQKQLLCITRIMLAKPPMLILDEATSSIDTRTEIKIQNAFAKLMEGRTSFIVAHRLSTIQSADVILVMKDGHIIEQGNHEELLAKNGFYHKLYYSQFDTVAQN